jgi:hypothetical protein
MADQFDLEDNMDDADLNARGEDDGFMDDAAAAADDVSLPTLLLQNYR